MTALLRALSRGEGVDDCSDESILSSHSLLRRVAISDGGEEAGTRRMDFKGSLKQVRG